MVFYQFFEHNGSNIGPATQLLVLLGLRGCRRKPLFGRSDLVLADSLERQWDITPTSDQGPIRLIFQLHPPKGDELTA